MTRSIVGAMLAGLALGVFGLIIACIACLAIAFTTRGEATLPGIFHAEFVTIDGMPQLGFLPDVPGMATALAIWTLLAGALGALAARRRRERGAGVEH
jgi:hypothetical protein